MMNNFNIRNSSENDVREMMNIYAYYVNNTAISFECEVPTIEDFNGKIANIKAKYPCLIAEVDGAIAGYAYAQLFVGREAYSHSTELTIYLKHELQYRGIGGALYRRLEEELGKMGIINLYACIGYPEVEDEYLTMNSVNFHSHLGFEICGRFYKCGYKFNRWYSMVWMEKIIGKHVDIQEVNFNERE